MCLSPGTSPAQPAAAEDECLPLQKPRNNSVNNSASGPSFTRAVTSVPNHEHLAILKRAAAPKNEEEA